jgi:cyclopropane fatty-acyl-phospholipid synthase-like methyltransferase
MINPVEWIRAYRFHKSTARLDKSQFDLELYLYSKMLKNDMLHYGYFEDVAIKPETISIEQLEQAQITYAEKIIDKIVNSKDPVLDAGCGMGGLAKLMLAKNLKVEVLTPNKNQIDYIRQTYKGLASHHCKFELFESTRRFGTIINSESLQYINLDRAFNKVETVLLPGGRWIIVDYFRLHGRGTSRSGHLLDTFREKLGEYGWRVVHEQDITPNVLPTLAFANMYVERFFIPLKHFAFERLRFKKPWLYYLTGKIRESIERKIDKEMAAIDSSKFIDEKKYLLFVLEKK